MQSYHHQELSLLLPSDLLEHVKLNGIYNVLFIEKFADPIIQCFFNDFVNVGQ